MPRKTKSVNKRSKKEEQEEVEEVETPQNKQNKKVATKTRKVTTKKAKSSSKKGQKKVATQVAKKSKKSKEQESEDEHIEAVDADVSENNDEERTKFDQISEEIDSNNRKILELQRENKRLYKKLTNSHKSEVKKARNKKRRPNSEPTGFAKSKTVGGKFADWLGVDRGSQHTGPEISNMFWEKMKTLGLQYEGDGRIFRTNKETCELFGIKKSVNKSTDHKDKKGFNMNNYQKKIKYALEHHNE